MNEYQVMYRKMLGLYYLKHQRKDLYMHDVLELLDEQELPFGPNDT